MAQCASWCGAPVAAGHVIGLIVSILDGLTFSTIIIIHAVLSKAVTG
jgi:hypothetical protein